MTPPNETQIEADRALVTRMLDGDRRAFDEFADDYVPQLYRFASRRVRDREITVEVVQSTVCKAIDKLATFRGEAALMTWLCATCRNEIAAWFREQGKRRMESEFESVEEFTPATNGPSTLGDSGIEAPESRAMRRESAARIHDALDVLSPRYAQVLEWKYIEEVPVREIAGRLQLSAKAAESLLTRARAAFRDVWNDSSTPAAAAVPNQEPVLMTSRGNQ